MIKALPVVDRLERDGRTLLLLEGLVVELSPVALAAYDAVSDGGLGVPELTDVLVDEFGAPEGAGDEVVRRLVQELASMGLVTSD